MLCQLSYGCIKAADYCELAVGQGGSFDFTPNFRGCGGGMYLRRRDLLPVPAYRLCAQSIFSSQACGVLLCPAWSALPADAGQPPWTPVWCDTPPGAGFEPAPCLRSREAAFIPHATPAYRTRIRIIYVSEAFTQNFFPPPALQHPLPRETAGVKGRKPRQSHHGGSPGNRASEKNGWR